MSGTGQRVVLHVGLPKTGTTYLQELMAAQRDRLRDAGVLYPFLRPGAMFHGAVELRGSHEKFGLDPGAVAGTWAALCERARSFPGTTVISHEVLAGATPEQVRRALAPLAGLEVHVVVTARDLGRQATAHWQEEVKLGDTRSFADLEREQLRADTGRDAGPDAGGTRPHFWHAQDFADALRRWTADLPADHGHLVVCPAPGAAPEELWRRFAAAVGVEADVLDPGRTAANTSLGVGQVAHLRAVNRAVGDRLGRAEQVRRVKRQYAEQVLAAQPGPRPVAPADLRKVLDAATRAWVEEVSAAGHRVHGDLAELAPVLGGPEDPHPDDVPAGAEVADDPRAVAECLVRGAAAPPHDARRRLRDRLRRPLRKARRKDGLPRDPQP